MIYAVIPGVNGIGIKSNACAQRYRPLVAFQTSPPSCRDSPAALPRTPGQIGGVGQDQQLSVTANLRPRRIVERRWHCSGRLQPKTGTPGPGTSGRGEADSNGDVHDWMTSEVLAALAAVGINGGIEPLEVGHTGAVGER